LSLSVFRVSASTEFSTLSLHDALPIWMDITQDIMLNIDEDSLKRQEVELKVTANIFSKPYKWDIKSFKKIISRDFELDYNLRRVIIGVHLNIEEGVPVPFRVGLKVDKDFEHYVELLEKSLYKEYRKHTQFEFVNLSEENELNSYLIEQGEVIFSR